MKKIILSTFILYITTNFCFAQLQFTESADDLGCINASYGSGLLGGGISFFDFDQDGWDDITLSSEEGLPVKFLKNNNGNFIEVNLNIDDPFFETKTVQWVDVDNDGDFDLFVTSNIDTNRLYENDGNLSFTNITNSAGLMTSDHRTFGASWGDYNNDGWLDLIILSRNLDENSIANILYKNNGDNTFTNVTNDAGLETTNYASFCASFIDFNNDGWQDIYIANDKYDNPNLMYKNNGDETFTEVGNSTNTNISIDAMSTTIGDYNNDGWNDIYVSNTFAGNSFLKNNGDETFSDIAHTNGTLMESVAFGSVFLDAENDGDQDLYVTGMLDSGETLLSAFYENDGTGQYSIPENIGFENDAAISFSNAIGDINNDGYPDIVVLNYAPYNMYLWKNDSSQDNNWIKIKLQGVISNRQGIGSTIEISVNGEKQYNYTLCGEGYLSQNSAYEFFGIGQATSIDYIKVTWLSGTVDFIENPPINSVGTVVEGTNVLSLPKNTNSTLVTLYPNPAQSFINLNLSKNLEGGKLNILDSFGRILFSKNNCKTSEKIAVSTLTPGFYFVTISTNNNNITKKITIK